MRTRYPHCVEQFLKLRTAMALAGGHDHRERPALAVAGEVQLGGEASLGAPQGLLFGV
ncbi:MAG: hypothetical protein AVDCRST_MAG25-2795 [uncultured Rubrobacteraceae bacterium]|uniref:Uncharacterized protein n=1 Tax=uncultured Rubrobacteraceae bacterium TaxID=349277 RepID=A0A6J4S2T1_9ACTN|nr:MAG: hypothetical protein AVDCRST_MAG25-2795 [uncultured Rubrobacteraceae bacterium]